MNSPHAAPIADTDVPHPSQSNGLGIVGLIWALVAAVWLFIGFGYLIVQGDQWYGQSLGAAQTSNWYAWPWGWPGAGVVERVFYWLGSEPWDHHADHVMRTFTAMPRFALAAVVNAIIAMLPLFAIGAGAEAWRNAQVRAEKK